MQEQSNNTKAKQVEKMLPEMPPPQETLQQKIDRFNQKFPNTLDKTQAFFWNIETKKWEKPYASDKSNFTQDKSQSSKKA
jgi:hypothetical protein